MRATSLASAYRPSGICSSIFTVSFIETTGHVGRNHPERQGVDGDLAARHFTRQRFRQSNHARLEAE
jgi:hypothetical protein